MAIKAAKAPTSPITVTAGRCAERGKKLIDNDEGIWDILE